MNKPVNPHGIPDELLGRLNDEEVRVQSLPINERTQSQQEWIDGIDAHIMHATEGDLNVDVDVDVDVDADVGNMGMCEEDPMAEPRVLQAEFSSIRALAIESR